MKKIGKILKYVEIVFEYSKWFGLLLIVLRLFNSFLPNIQIYVNAKLIDNLNEVYVSKRTENFAYQYLICFLFLLFINWGMSQILSLISVKMSNEIREKYKPEMLKHCSKIKLSEYENKNSQDLISRVTRNIENEIVDTYNTIFTICEVIIRFGGLIFIIAKFSLVGAISILILNIPLLILSKKNGEVTYQADKNVELIERHNEKLADILIGRDASVERNIFKFSDWIKCKWNKQYSSVENKQLNAFFKYFWKTIFYSMISGTVAISMFFLLSNLLKNSKISIGMFLSMASALLSIETLIIQRITQLIKFLSFKIEFISDVNKFYELPICEEKILEGLSDDFIIENIEFKNVTFRYNNSEEKILNNFSLKLEAKKHYAIVGENGAGKSTIVKLLCLLYDDYEGEICINGIEIRKIGFENVKKLFSVMFQETATYGVSLYDNLMVGLNDDKREKLDGILDFVGIKNLVDSLPNGMDTCLGKFEQDFDLSVGQWKRIGIARGLIRNATVKIFDEPTANIDPIAEKDIYEKYHLSNRNKMSIFISHRLGSIKNMDEIIMLKNGRVEDKGSFEELYNRNMEFAKMYNEQRRWYYEGKG